MSSAPPAPADAFATFTRWLIRAVDKLRMWGPLPGPLGQAIIGRIILIDRRFRRLAGRIAAGTYRPRRTGPRPAQDRRKPRQINQLLQKSGWLARLLPCPAQSRGQLLHFLQDPEVVALIAAAPAEMARVLRPLCWALSLKPPPILAAPRRAVPKTPATAPAPPTVEAPPASRPHRTSPDSPFRRLPSARWPRKVRTPPHPA